MVQYHTQNTGYSTGIHPTTTKSLCVEKNAVDIAISLDVGGVNVKLEYTRRAGWPSGPRIGSSSKTGSSAIFRSFLITDVPNSPPKLQKGIPKQGPEEVNFGTFRQNTGRLRHVPPPFPLRKNVVLSVTDRHGQTDRQTCDEQRFLDPPYTIALRATIRSIFGPCAPSSDGAQASNWSVSITLES